MKRAVPPGTGIVMSVLIGLGLGVFGAGVTAHVSFLAALGLTIALGVAVFWGFEATEEIEP